MSQLFQRVQLQWQCKSSREYKNICYAWSYQMSWKRLGKRCSLWKSPRWTLLLKPIVIISDNIQNVDPRSCADHLHGHVHLALALDVINVFKSSAWSLLFSCSQILYFSHGHFLLSFLVSSFCLILSNLGQYVLNSLCINFANTQFCCLSDILSIRFVQFEYT